MQAYQEGVVLATQGGLVLQLIGQHLHLLLHLCKPLLAPLSVPLLRLLVLHLLLCVALGLCVMMRPQPVVVLMAFVVRVVVGIILGCGWEGLIRLKHTGP